jgi:hypothetical protein
MTQAGHDAIGKLLAVFDDDFIELVKYCKRVIDNPEPQADDVETIRDLEEVEEALQMAEKVGEETKNPTPWQFNTLMQVRRGKEALTRLSAPVDVQAKAEAVIDNPDPQADDVETIRALVEEHGIAQEFDIDDGVKLVRFALTRLSAPVDVQARAEAVVQEFSDTYVMLSADTEYELSRLIVEQFTRKG